MAQYYLQKKHSKRSPVKADKDGKKVKSANKEKILLLKAKRPVSKAASFNKQAMMSTQREALKINNNLTPVLRLQMSNNHPQASQNHHQRVKHDFLNISKDKNNLLLVVFFIGANSS